MKTIKWKELYSDSGTETKEEALIRIVNSDDFRVLYKHQNKGYLLDLAEEFGTTRMAINKKLGRLKDKGLIRPMMFEKTIVTPDKKFEKKHLVDDLLKLVIDGNKILREFDLRQEEVNPSLDYSGWVGLVIGGDWHFEHFRTNLEGIIADLKLIGGTPNLYYGFNGDLGDFIDLRFMELENETLDIPLRLRYKMIEKLVSYVPNMLFMTCGCHDNWVRTRARYDIIAELQHKIMGYYLGYGGILNWRLGVVTYRIASFHKMPGSSIYNPFHATMRFLRDTDANVDIVATSHRHDLTGMVHTYYQGQPKILVRSGSHQYKTNYAWKEGFRGAISRYPMILLNGSEKRMIPYANFKDGLPVLKALNDGRLKDEEFLSVNAKELVY
jgi:hypothetical protein